jgi:hypothetical protein
VVERDTDYQWTGPARFPNVDHTGRWSRISPGRGDFWRESGLIVITWSQFPGPGIGGRDLKQLRPFHNLIFRRESDKSCGRIHAGTDSRLGYIVVLSWLVIAFLLFQLNRRGYRSVV